MKKRFATILITLAFLMTTAVVAYACARSLQLEHKGGLQMNVNLYSTDRFGRRFSLDACNIPDAVRVVNRSAMSIKLIAGLSNYAENLIYALLKPFGLHIWKGRTYREIRCNRKRNILYGYFQTEKYFSKHAPVIKRELKIIKPISEENRRWIAEIDSTNSVCLHIRRGDYLNVMYVLSALFDITWLFQGLENFKTVVIKNAAVKIIECIAIFYAVHTPDDLWIYTFITSAGLLLGQMVMIPQAVSMLKPICFSVTDIKSHIKPLLVFSVAVIAATLYTVFGKTLLGIMTTKENVAYYEYANRIIGIPKTFMTVIGTVMFPRACKLAAMGDIKGQKKYLSYSLTMLYFVGFASLFGMASVSKLFAVVYLGQDFAPSGDVMISMCAVPLIVGLGDVLRTQYLIASRT